MDHSIFENNWSVLEKLFPQTATVLSRSSMDNFPAEVVPTKTAAPSLRVRTSERGNVELLHSAYDPLREAQRWAESLSFEEPINVILFGVGLGYHLLTLVRQHHSSLRHIVVIEREPRILRCALAVVDLRAIFQRTGFYLIVGEAPEAIPELLRDVRSDIMIHNFRFLEHPPSVRCYPDYYTVVQRKILDALTHDEVNLRTNFENQGRNHFNLYMNLPAIIRGYALKDGKNLLRGFPAVVSAAGPSLDKNFRLTRELKDSAALFIVDTAQNSYKKEGIAPDVVVTGDPTPLNFSHFEKIDDLGNAFLAFHPEVQRLIVQKFIHHPYLLPMFDCNTPLASFLFDPENSFGTMDRAMNVGHLAVNLALHMGCDPIILIGFDFAFPRNGGTTHAVDAAVSRSMYAMEADGTIRIDGKEGKAIAESGQMMLVPGYDGDEVPTTVPFSLYIRALEKTVAQTSARVVDATEGGAFFQGTERMSFRDAIQRYLREPGVGARFDFFRRCCPSPPYDAVLERLQEGRVVLEQSVSLCDRMIAILQEWRVVVPRRSVSLPEAHQHWQAFEKIWVEMCGNPLFDSFVGASVQPLYFLRQRTTRPKDDSGNAFLQLIGEKYFQIVPEMKTIIRRAIECVDLSRSALEAHRALLS